MSSLCAVVNLGQRALHGLDASCGLGARNRHPVIIGIQTQVVELMERKAEGLQQPRACGGMGGQTPIAPHKMIDNGPVTPLSARTRWIAQCGPHRLIGGIIRPRHGAGEAFSGQKKLGIVEVALGEYTSFWNHLLPFVGPVVRPPPLPVLPPRADSRQRTAWQRRA